MYVTESLCCIPEADNIVNQLYSNIKEKGKQSLVRGRTKLGGRSPGVGECCPPKSGDHCGGSPKTSASH